MKSALWADALSCFSTDGPIYLAGCCGEPTAFLDSLEDDPDLARGRRFTGVWIPGVNKRDPTGYGERTATTIFASPTLQNAIQAGRVNLLPMHYSTTFKWLSKIANLSGGIFQVPPPQGGSVGLGLSSDFTPGVVASNVPLIGQINPSMPDIIDGPRIPIQRFQQLIEIDSPLIEYESGTLDQVYAAIGQNIAELVNDGDTLQLGLGKLQNAVLDSLSKHHSLKLHGGMVSPNILACLKNGSFVHATTGVALGDRQFYNQISNEARVSFRPVSITHNLNVLANIECFVSINSILEVDLFGQGNGEFLGETQITGHGGLLDFIRGASLSEGGRSILALPATAGGGTISRITPCLPAGVPVTLPRADVDWIVTEYGAVCLRHATVQQRAERIISIAAPQFRAELACAWHTNMRRARSDGRKQKF